MKKVDCMERDSNPRSPCTCTCSKNATSNFSQSGTRSIYACTCIHILVCVDVCGNGFSFLTCSKVIRKNYYTYMYVIACTWGGDEDSFACTTILR